MTLQQKVLDLLNKNFNSEPNSKLINAIEDTLVSVDEIIDNEPNNTSALEAKQSLYRAYYIAKGYTENNHCTLARELNTTMLDIKITIHELIMTNKVVRILDNRNDFIVPISKYTE